MASIKQWTTPLKGVESLKLTEAPKPAPGKGEVLVEIHAVSLNYRDIEGTVSASFSMVQKSELTL